MLTLEQIVSETAPIFEKELVLPEPPIQFKDKMLALEEANLPRQKSACLFDMRKWQVEQLGFKRLSTNEAVKMLMGDPHTDYKEGETHKIEYVYNHHNGNIETTWTAEAGIFSRKEKIGLWYFPPFCKKIKWEVQHGRLDYLKRELPYGVVLRINELKNLKLFNSFSVVAPMEAWLKQSDIDPIVMANLYLLPPDDKGKYTNAGETTSYFIAKW